MAEITEIIAKEAIKDIEAADKALTGFDEGIMKVINHLGQLNQVTGKGGIKEYNTALKEQAKVQSEAVKATKAREVAERKAAAAEEKAAQKIREHNEALKLNVKTVEDAKRQLKALTIERDKQVTAAGKQSKSVQELNAKMQQNTEFIRQNGTAAEKQRMNIGNYASAMNGVKAAAISVMGALGLTAGLAGAMKLFQGVVNSTQEGADTFQKTIYGLREQFSYLQRAVYNFDFSNFHENMKAARIEGERYYNTLDLIGDLQRANAIQQGDIDRQILEQRIIAKNRQNDLQTREAAIKEIIRLEELKLSKTQSITKKDIDNELQNAESRTKISKQRIQDFVTNYENYVDEIAKGQALINKITKETQSEQVTQYGSQTIVDTKAREQAYKNLSKEQQTYLFYANLEKKLTDEQRDAIKNKLVEDQKATNEMLSGKESLIRLQNSLRRELIKEEDEVEKASNKASKANEKQATAMEVLVAKISDLKEQVAELLLTGQSVPDGLVRQLMGSEAELNRVNEQVKDIAKGIQSIASKGATGFSGGSTGGNAGLLQPRTYSGGTIASQTDKNSAQEQQDINDLALSGTQSVSDAAFQIISNYDQAAYDNKIALLEKEKEAKLSNTKLTEKQRAKIEEEYRKKEAKIKEEQFRKQKAADIVQSIINTAVAVTKVLDNPILAAAVAIAGAAETAVIATQPVPQFDAGVLSTPSTFIAGERRPEWMIAPDGSVSLVTRPTMFKNMAGATVIGGAETERMLQAGEMPGADIRPDIRQMRNDIVRAIKDKRELHISGSGSRITERDGNYYKTYFNRQVQWAGRKN